MVGDGYGGHGEGLGLLEEIIKTNGSVKEAVLSMHVKMNEIGVFHKLVNGKLWRVNGLEEKYFIT